MKLSPETNDKEFNLTKTKAKSNCTRKTIGCFAKPIGCFAETIGCLYQFANIKTEFKELRDRKNAHRDLYWFTLNP